MKEKNRIKLKKGLQNLPEYSPPDELWGGINNELDVQKNDAPLHEAIAKLPSYDPPVNIWDQIETKLPTKKVVALRARRRRYTRWLAAASVALLLGSGLFFLNRDANASEEIISYSYDTASSFEGVRGKDNADAMIEEVLSEVQKVKHKWEAPETVALKNSLDNIKSSIIAFKEAGENLGMNQRMHEQLTDMYNKRNKIVRALAAKI